MNRKELQQKASELRQEAMELENRINNGRHTPEVMRLILRKVLLKRAIREYAIECLLAVDGHDFDSLTGAVESAFPDDLDEVDSVVAEFF